jgi:3-hydroxyacyl-[acyl-carrier-protein] dehydratase
MILEIDEIQKLLPHNPPMLLVDRIIDIVPHQFAIGLKNITMAEPYFVGNFSEEPVMPKGLILEAMIQVGCVNILFPNSEENSEKIALVEKIDNVKFIRSVIPGDQLVLKTEMICVCGDLGRLHADVFVGDQFVARGNFIYALKRKNCKLI